MQLFNFPIYSKALSAVPWVGQNDARFTVELTLSLSVSLRADSPAGFAPVCIHAVFQPISQHASLLGSAQQAPSNSGRHHGQ